MFYPAQFEAAEEGGFVVTFRDIPEAITQGDNELEALTMAQDALVTAFEFYFDDKRAIPKPSKPLMHERLIEVPLSVTAKVLLLNEMLKQKVKPSELARRLDMKPQEVQRIINLFHSTKIDTISMALGALGQQLDLRVQKKLNYDL
jgi:antitoxin HicB